MTALTALALLAAPVQADEPPLSLHNDFIRADDLPTAPPTFGEEPWNVVDLTDLSVVRMPRSVPADAFSTTDFRAAIAAAVAHRSTEYDIVIVTHSDELVPDFGNAAAFQMAFNNADVWGTGDDPVITPDMPVRSALWMNHVDYWDSWGADLADWVFCHEVGHQWLAFPSTIPDPHSSSGETDDELALLGRQRAHWSFFLDTANSPMEGNAWVDNGDGTYTTHLTSGMVFNPLDLYMMGLREAAAVPDFLLLEPTGPTDLFRERSPQHRYDDEGPVTLEASPRTVTIDDLIAANGPWQSGDYTAAHIQALHVVLLMPHEPLSFHVLDRAREKRSEWLDAWAFCTGEESVLELGVVDEGWTVPDIPTRPALIPGGAW